MWWNDRLCGIRRVFSSAALCLALCGVPVFAQQPKEKPNTSTSTVPWEAGPVISLPAVIQPTPPQPPTAPPPPTVPVDPVVSAPAVPAPVVPVYVPGRVTLPSGAVLNVTLETPLSTRIAKKDQKVTFRTMSAVQLSDGLELPPDTAIQGTVVEAKKPGGFGKAGVIRVRIDRVELTPGVSAPLVARLQSADMDKQGRIRADNAHATDLLQLGQYTLTGTLLGARIGGGKGAVIGAGAGALASLIIMMSQRGPDVYLEPGMPFSVVLEQTMELPGQGVLDAQANYAQAHPTTSAGATGNANAGDPNMTIPPNERPVLKHRPKRP